MTWQCRDCANAARCNLGVLLTDGSGQVVHAQAVRNQLGRIDPDAHGLLGAEQLHAPDAFDPAQFVDHVAGHVIAEFDFAEASIVRFQADNHQKAG